MYFEDVVYIGGSSVMVKTKADSSNVTDSPHHIQPTTGMFIYDIDQLGALQSAAAVALSCRF